MTKRRDLYIVSTDRKDLYELLKKRFGNEEDIEVILDRRGGELRSPARAPKATPARGDRRACDERYHLLKNLGIIHVSAWRGEAAPPRRQTPR